jgi:hypothetical protein
MKIYSLDFEVLYKYGRTVGRMDVANMKVKTQDYYLTKHGQIYPMIN